jgi:hypothetical protein
MDRGSIALKAGPRAFEPTQICCTIWRRELRSQRAIIA